MSLHSRRLHRFLAFFLSLVMVAWSPVQVWATSYVWNATGTSNGGSDGSGTWNTSSTDWASPWNAYGFIAPWSNTTSDIAFIGGGGAPGTVTVAGGGVTAGGLVFAPTISGTYTLAGGPVTLGSGGLLMSTNTNGPTIIGSSLTATGAGISFGGNANITVYGNVNTPTLLLGGSGAVAATLNLAGASINVPVINLFGAPTLNITGNITSTSLTVLGTGYGGAGGQAASGAATISGAIGSAAAPLTSIFVGNQTSSVSGSVISFGGPIYTAALTRGNESQQFTIYGGAAQNIINSFTTAGSLNGRGDNTNSGTTIDYTQSSVATNLIASSIVGNSNLTTLALDGGNLVFNGKGSTTVSQSFFSTAVQGGVTVIAPLSGAGGTFNLNLGTVTRSNNAVAFFGQPTTGTVSATGLSNNVTTGTIGGWALTLAGNQADSVSQTPSWAVVSGATIIPLASFGNVYGGAGVNLHFKTGTAFTGAATWSPYDIIMSATTANTLANGAVLTVQDGGFAFGGNNSTITLGGGQVTSGTSDLIITALTSNASATVTSQVIDGTSGQTGLTLSQRGGSITINPSLSGVSGTATTNLYTGPTTIAYGLVKVPTALVVSGSGADALGSNGANNGIVLNGGTLDLSTGTVSSTTNRQITIGPGGGGLEQVKGVGGVLNLTGPAFNFLSGAGTLFLGVDNAINGPINLNFSSGSTNNTTPIIVGEGNVTLNNLGGAGRYAIGSGGLSTSVTQTAGGFTVTWGANNQIDPTGPISISAENYSASLVLNGKTQTFGGGVTMVSSNTTSAIDLSALGSKLILTSDVAMFNNSGGPTSVIITNTGGTNTTGGLLLNGTRTFTVGSATPGFDATANAEIDANILDDNVTAGGPFPGKLVKDGPKALLLTSASNTYSGGTEVKAGTLVANASGSLGAAAGTVTLDAGSELAIGNATIANPISVAGTNVTLSGSNATAGVLSGANTLALSTNGVNVALRDYTGVGSGLLTARNLTITDGVTGSGAFNVTAPAGAATLKFNGAPSGSYTGTIVVNPNATVAFDLSTLVTPTGGALTTASALTLNQGAVTVTGKTSAAATQTLSGGLTLAANTANSITVTAGATAAATLLDFSGGSFTRNAGSTLNIDISNNATLTNVKAPSAMTTGTVLNYVTVKNSAAVFGFGTVNGSGNIVPLTTFTGTLPTTGATSANDYNLTASTTLGASESANTLTLAPASGGQILDLNGFNLFAGQATAPVLFTGANAFTINATGGGTLGDAASNPEVIVHQMSATALTVNAVVGGGSGSLTKDGPGTLILAANNSYTGKTTIGGGTLQVGNAGTTGSLGSGAVANSGTLAFNLTSPSTTFANNVSGVGGVTQAGSGTLFLTNSANSYTGVTAVTGGILNVASLTNGGFESSIGAALAGTSGKAIATNSILLNGGTLQYTGSTPQTTDRLISVGLSNGTIDASGTGSGTLTFSNAGTFGFTTIAAHTFTLTGSNTGANTFNPIISDNTGLTGLTKTGAGTWVLTGASIYTGATLVSAGTLQVGNGSAGSISVTTPVTDNATLVFNTSAATAFSNLLAGTTGSFVQAGSGTTTISGSQKTYTGGFSVTGGNLTLDLTNAITNISGNSPALTLGNGTLNVKGGAGTSSQSFSSTTLLAGTQGTLFNTSSASTTTTINVGSITRPTGATVYLDDTNTPAKGIYGTSMSNGTLGYATYRSGTAVQYSLATVSSGTISAIASYAGTLGAASTFNDPVGDYNLAVAGVFTMANNNTVGTLSANNVGNAQGSFIIAAGKTLTLGNGGILYDGTANNPQSISGPGTLASSTGEVIVHIATATETLTIGAPISSANLTKDLTGTLVLANSYAGNIFNNTPTGLVNFTEAGTVRIDSGTLAGGGNYSYTGTAGAALTLSGTNTYTGSTTINSGILAVTTLANGGLASGIGASTNAAANLVIAGTLQFAQPTTSTPSSTDRLFTISGAAVTLDASGVTGSTVSFTNTGSPVYAVANLATTLTFTGSNTGANTFAQSIGNNSAVPTAVSKTGAGTWVFTGANIYSGATSVSAGKLLLGQGGALAQTPVTVSGSATFGTSYTTSGNSIFGGSTLTLTSGALNLQDGFANILAFSGAGSIAGSTSLNFDVGATTGVNDQLTFGSATTFSGTQTFNINPLGGSFVDGTHYVLVSDSSGLSGFTVPAAQTVSGHTLTFGSNSTSVYLDVSAAGGNTSVLTVPATASLRVLSGTPSTTIVNVSNTVSSDTHFTASAAAGGTVSPTSSTSILSGATSPLTLGYSDNTTTGARSGIAITISNVDNTADNSPGTNHIVTLSGAVVVDRTYTVTPATSRVLVGTPLAVTIGSAADTNNATIVNWGNNTFTTGGVTALNTNGTGSFSGANSLLLSFTFASAGAQTASFDLHNGGASPILTNGDTVGAVAQIVDLSGISAVNQRTFTSPGPFDFGSVLLGTPAATLSQSLAITTGTGNRATTADSTLGGSSVSGTLNGLTASGSVVTSDGTSGGTLNRTISGTLSSSGVLSGTFNFNATDEFANTVTSAANVSYTVHAFDPAVLTPSFGGGNATLTATAGANRASATVSDSTTVTYQSGGTSGFSVGAFSTTAIAPGGAANFPVSFDSTNRIAGTLYDLVKFTARNDAAISGSAAGDLNSQAQVLVSATVGVYSQNFDTAATAYLLPGQVHTDLTTRNTNYSFSPTLTTGPLGHDAAIPYVNYSVASKFDNTTNSNGNLNFKWVSPANASGPPTYVAALGSDVLDVSGIDGQLFVLTMTYDPSKFSAAIQRSAIEIVSYDTVNSKWVGATALDHGSNLAGFDPIDESFSTFETNGLAAYQMTHPLATEGDFLAANLGAYGVDTTTDQAWAVVNHNSEFAVVPEPSTLALMAFGALAGFGLWRRKKRVVA